jgi:hypothetical protein
MDLGKAFSYVFDDPKWLRKLLLAAFVTVVPTVGPIILVGWLLETLRNIRAGQPYPIPEWSGDDLARWLGRGVAATVTMAAWIVPCLLVLGLILGCGSFSLQTIGIGVLGAAASGRGATDLAAGLSTASLLASCCFLCLILLGVLIVALGSIVPYIRFAATDQIDVGLDYRTNFSLLFSNIGPFLMVVVVGLIAAVVMIIVNTLTCGLGWFVTPTYLGLVFMHLYSNLAQLIDRASPAAA